VNYSSETIELLTDICEHM